MKNVFKSSLLNEKCIFNVFIFIKSQEFKVLKNKKFQENCFNFFGRMVIFKKTH